MFLNYAQAAARAQQFYVSVEDPRLHLSLGQVALAIYDAELLREAKTFLRFFKLKECERRLDQIAQSRRRDYDFLAEDLGLSAPTRR